MINLKHIPNIKFLEWNPADISLPWNMQQSFVFEFHTHPLKEHQLPIKLKPQLEHKDFLIY